MDNVFVGYKRQKKEDKKVAFPFGRGLSYTAFKYSKLTVSTSGDGLDGMFAVYAYVKNTVETAGAHVFQVWAEYRKDMAVTKPSKELKGYS
jgi:beta-glucosidase